MDGFGVIETVGAGNMPQVIFVTAFDQYALQAFEVNAIDYLFKPFEKDRFKNSLRKAVEFVKFKKNIDAGSSLTRLIHDFRNKDSLSDRLVIKQGGKYTFLKTEEIDRIESAGNYLTVITGREKHIMRGTMAGMEQKLDSKKFVHIHRRTIVNIDTIRGLEHIYGGE